MALLSPPYSLGPVLVSNRLLNPSSDIKMKHGLIGLLKHIAQSKPGSPAINSILDEVNTLQRVAECQILEERPDPMTSIVQLSAIGLAKHLCSSSRTDMSSLHSRFTDFLSSRPCTRHVPTFLRRNHDLLITNSKFDKTH